MYHVCVSLLTKWYIYLLHVSIISSIYIVSSSSHSGRIRCDQLRYSQSLFSFWYHKLVLFNFDLIIIKDLKIVHWWIFGMHFCSVPGPRVKLQTSDILFTFQFNTLHYSSVCSSWAELRYLTSVCLLDKFSVLIVSKYWHNIF